MTGARTIIEGCAIATVDAAGSEHRDGHVVIEGDRIVAVGAGAAPHAGGEPVTRIDGRGCLATPGLVNCHHHLYQSATRGLAQQSTLFEWLVELYPVWARIDEEVEWAAARAGHSAATASNQPKTRGSNIVPTSRRMMFMASSWVSARLYDRTEVSAS